MDLPELPEPLGHVCCWMGGENLYTSPPGKDEIGLFLEHQMQAYARQAVLMAKDRARLAAGICRQTAKGRMRWE